MPRQDRPKEFSSYASRIAWNLLANMAPPRNVTGDRLDNASRAALPGASADLRSFWTRTAAIGRSATGRTPATAGLPMGTSIRWRGSTRRSATC